MEKAKGINSIFKEIFDNCSEKEKEEIKDSILKQEQEKMIKRIKK